MLYSHIRTVKWVCLSDAMLYLVPVLMNQIPHKPSESSAGCGLVERKSELTHTVPVRISHSSFQVGRAHYGKLATKWPIGLFKEQCHNGGSLLVFAEY